MSDTKVCNECGETKPLSEFNKRGGTYKNGEPKLFGKCRSCSSDYHKKYRAEHPEFAKSQTAKNKEYKEANKEKYDEYHKRYAKERWAKQKAAKPQRKRLTKEEKKHRAKESSQRWKSENTDRTSAYWNKRHHERMLSDPEYAKQRREFCRIRRVRRAGAGGSHTLAEWESLKQAHNYTCLCCKKQEPEIALTVDHVLPLVMGGTDDISNIQPLCFSCNTKKNAKHIDYR